MKKNQALFSIAIVGTLLSFTSPKHVDSYNIDSKQSTVEWYAEKVTGKHNGTIMLSGGVLQNDHGQIKGWVEMNMTSIANSDIKDAGTKAKLEGHLKSADFFSSDKYPTSKFVITSMTPLATNVKGHTHTVVGNLTIKDKTNAISFPANVKTEKGKITCIGEAIVDRSKFDVQYGSKTFFPNIGDKMINDEFKMKFNVVAIM